MDIRPRYATTNLSWKVRQAADELAVTLPEGLALLYWDHGGICRAFSLNEDNLHFAASTLNGVYKHRSEIVPV